MEGSIQSLEVVGSSNYQNHDHDYDHDRHSNKMTIKRKRTHMPSSTASSASSSGTHCSFSSPTSPSASGEITEEEEDMANCLILLAQGHHDHQNKLIINYANINVYECKTCNRTFPSFQALGGHRASHKKPKTDDKKPCVTATSAVPSKQDHHQHQHHRHHDLNHDQDHHHNHVPVFFTKNIITTSNKVHECSICRAEFSSGQALGGHMRRHRASPNPNIISAAAAPNLLPSSLHGDDVSFTKRRSNNILPLDLNLPAPEEDFHKSTNSESKFGFVISAVPALVDCHY